MMVERTHRCDWMLIEYVMARCEVKIKAIYTVTDLPSWHLEEVEVVMTPLAASTSSQLHLTGKPIARFRSN